MTGAAAAYVADLISAPIEHWHLPQHGGLHLTIYSRHGRPGCHGHKAHQRDVRVCSPHTVELDGRTVRWDTFVAQHERQWFRAPLACDAIGTITDMAFQLHWLSGDGRTHYNGTGHITMRLTIDPARDHTLTLHALHGNNFIKLM